MARILIVDDEPDILLSLEEDLRRQGHVTTIASDGEQGLRLGKDSPWDLILLDVMLPKLDGIDVCAELRKAGVLTPIIMLTARAQEAEKEIGLDAGADDYVTKPFSLRELRARVVHSSDVQSAAAIESAASAIARSTSNVPSCGGQATRLT